MRDPQLLRLGEVEARIAFAERALREQEAMVASLTARGHSAALARELLGDLRESLGILAERRRRILALMQEARTPLPSHVTSS